MQELLRQREDSAISFASVQDLLRSAVEEKRSIMVDVVASLEEERVRQGRFLASFAETMRWGFANATEAISCNCFSSKALRTSASTWSRSSSHPGIETTMMVWL